MQDDVHHGTRPWRTDLPWLLAFWLFATAWNLAKPFHIDDTAYLDVARWIAANPWRPMSGVVHWGHDPEPIPVVNQPHLFFYLSALVGHLTGWRETPQHLLQAGFALAAILLYHRIALRLAPTVALFATALLCLGPGFVVNQNAMVDIPQLALATGCYWALIAYRPRIDSRRVLVAGLFMAAAVLVKYTSLLLIPALLLDVALRRNWRQLPYVAIPVVALILWSGFNWLDYGGIHILERPLSDPGTKWPLAAIQERSTAWLLCLGAILPFPAALVVAAGRQAGRWWRPLGVLASVALGAALICTVLWFLILAGDEALANRMLRLIFVISGTTGVAFGVYASVRAWSAPAELRNELVLLVYWAWSSAAFVIVLAPFMSTRHVLLSLAPGLLLVAHRLERWLTRPWCIGTAVLGAALGGLLAAGDIWGANSYRDAAASVRAGLPATATVWFSGHWGWQWYAREAGMRQIASNHPQVVVGDYLVYPRAIHQQIPPVGVTLSLESSVVLERCCVASYFAGKAASFYRSTHKVLPWSMSRTPFDTIDVYRVTGTAP